MAKNKGPITARYTCCAVSFELEAALTRDDGSERAPAVSVKLRVLEGPETGKTVTWRGSLHDNAAPYTLDALRRMGWSCNDVTALTGLGDTKVTAIERLDTWEDKDGKMHTRKRIESIYEISAPRPTVAEEDRAAFAKRFKALAAASKVSPVGEHNKAPEEIPEEVVYAETPPPSAGNSFGPDVNDDIPF